MAKAKSGLFDQLAPRPLADRSQIREVRVAYRRSMAESQSLRTVVDALVAAGTGHRS